MESPFAATLPARERKLAGRLEGFGDIVFGFAVSQCALQLPLVGGHVDPGHVLGLLAYFGTFAILATLWLTFHALMSGCFRPGRLDLFLAFAYLALVTLMPYALFWASHQHASLASARGAVAQYATVFASLLFLSAIVTVRNLRRGWTLLDEGEREHEWRSIVRRLTLGIVVTLALIVDLAIGPFESSGVFLLLLVVPRVATHLLREPRPRVLRIASEAASTQ